jgi:hypothetical protein
MNQVKAELSASLGEAVARQSQQCDANFQDHKKALMQPKRKTPANGEAEMSD